MIVLVTGNFLNTQGQLTLNTVEGSYSISISSEFLWLTLLAVRMKKKKKKKKKKKRKKDSIKNETTRVLTNFSPL